MIARLRPPTGPRTSVGGPAACLPRSEGCFPRKVPIFSIVAVAADAMAAMALQDTVGLVSAWSTVALALLLLARFVLQPHLSAARRRSFDIAVVPLLAILVVFIVSDVFGGPP